MTRTNQLILYAAMAFVALSFALMQVQPPRDTLRDNPRDGRANLTQPIELAAEGPQKAAGDNSPRFEVSIRKPEGPPTVRLTSADPLGRTAEVACSTCHSVRKPNFENKTDATLDEFHQGLKVSHGKVACYGCHNAKNADALKSADGQTIAYQDVMTLCSQCHGQQANSFAHGAHGGMNGFWDLTKGPQTKNNCIDCHDPHSPAYPKMVVDFKPKDRFNHPEADHEHE